MWWWWWWIDLPEIEDVCQPVQIRGIVFVEKLIHQGRLPVRRDDESGTSQDLPDSSEVAIQEELRVMQTGEPGTYGVHLRGCVQRLGRTY